MVIQFCLCAWQERADAFEAGDQLEVACAVKPDEGALESVIGSEQPEVFVEAGARCGGLVFGAVGRSCSEERAGAHAGVL